MSKALKNYILVAGLIIASLAEMTSGFVLWFALPHGGGGGRWGTLVPSEFWSLSRDTWTSMHDWAAVALIVIALVHIYMHWNWVWRMTKRYLGFASAQPAPVRVVNK